MINMSIVNSVEKFDRLLIDPNCPDDLKYIPVLNEKVIRLYNQTNKKYDLNRLKLLVINLWNHMGNYRVIIWLLDECFIRKNEEAFDLIQILIREK